MCNGEFGLGLLVMEDIPLRVTMEDRTYDHDESDYLLSNSDTSGVDYSSRGRRGRKSRLYRYGNTNRLKIILNGIAVHVV